MNNIQIIPPNSKTKIRLKDRQIGTGDDWIVWYYNGIVKNEQENSQPYVEIGFRKLVNGNVLPGFLYQKIPITYLGQFRIGSVWKCDTCIGEIEYQTSIFEVNLNSRFWRHTSFALSSQNKEQPPYTEFIYPLDYKNDRNWYLEFDLPEKGKLVIPSLEYLYRCYGRSSELKRVIVTYPWESGINDSKLYAPLQEKEESGVWKVRLTRRLSKGDVIFLAYAKYTDIAKSAAKSIYGQIEAAYANGEKPIFIQAMPWFEEVIKIKVKGIPFGDNSFLASQIVGCSDPTGKPIYSEKKLPAENNSISVDNSDEESDINYPVMTINAPPMIVDLTGTLEPGHGMEGTIVNDPEFEVLGEPRQIIDVHTYHAQRSKNKYPYGIEAGSYSTGEPFGAPNGVGSVLFAPHIILESQGALREMWVALKYFKEKYPMHIQDICWYTPSNGFISSDEPELLSLHPFEQTDDVEDVPRHWPFMEPQVKNSLRGILIVRLEICNKYIYIIEIQRRIINARSEYFGKISKEESFRGFICKFTKDSDFEEWIVQKFCYRVRFVGGIVGKLIHGWPGKAAAFNHVVSNNSPVLYYETVRNALSKMEIFL